MERKFDNLTRCQRCKKLTWWEGVCPSCHAREVGHRADKARFWVEVWKLMEQNRKGGQDE